MELGLFPLGIVLLPTEVVPLHIFEPRYQELVGECLELDREFGLLLADDDGIRDVGTRAAIMDVLDRFDDGRMNILVEGRSRFRVARLTRGRSFRTAEIEELEDGEGDAADEDVEAALTAYRRVAAAAEADPDEPEPSPILSYALAARVDLGVEPKQELLELVSEAERLRLVTELFESAAVSIEAARQFRDAASRNGKAR
jgi:Lon protease-like protein